MPRWVKLVVIVAAIAALIVVAFILLGGGHNPRRHGLPAVFHFSPPPVAAHYHS